MEKLILNNNLTYSYNPFGGISDWELPKIIVPKPFTHQIIKDLSENIDCIIELVGKKGRGKTSHLKLIHQQFPQAPLFQLSAKNSAEKLLTHPSPLVFIDSIHHLRLISRIRLFKQKRKIVLTTHTHRLAEYWWSNKRVKSYKFKAIDEEILAQILKNRIRLATNINEEKIQLNEPLIHQLITRFKDDYRGILNHLYHHFKG